MRREKAFTLLEMSLVLILVGTLIAMGLPALELLLRQNKVQDERVDVREAGRALLGFALASSGFPDYPLDEITGQRRQHTLPAAALGLKADTAYAKPLYYDVNAALIASDKETELCVRLLSQIEAMATQPPWPQVCAKPQCDADDEGFTSVGVVVVGSGANYRLDGVNGNGGRRYENPSRAFDADYDDTMVSYSLYELAAMFGCNAHLITEP